MKNCECADSREYLIIGVWKFHEESDRIEVLQEHTVDTPYCASDNIKPLNISEQAKVAFWFERNDKSGELMYCDISLEGEVPAEKVEKTKIRLNDNLTALLSDSKKTFFYSLSRINTADGEPILVFSKPKAEATAGAKHFSMLASHHEEQKS